MTKDEALKMAIDCLECHQIDVLNVCKEALEQPSVAELNDEYLRDTHVEGLVQSKEPQYLYVYVYRTDKGIELGLTPHSAMNMYNIKLMGKIKLEVAND